MSCNTSWCLTVNSSVLTGVTEHRAMPLGVRLVLMVSSSVYSGVTECCAVSQGVSR